MRPGSPRSGRWHKARGERSEARVRFGESLSVEAYAAEIEGFIDDQNAYNGDIAALDERSNLLDAREQRLADLSQRIMAAVKGQFGPDSNEFERAGGVRRSDRKKRTRTTKVPATA